MAASPTVAQPVAHAPEIDKPQDSRGARRDPGRAAQADHACGLSFSADPGIGDRAGT